MSCMGTLSFKPFMYGLINGYECDMGFNIASET